MTRIMILIVGAILVLSGAGCSNEPSDTVRYRLVVPDDKKAEAAEWIKHTVEVANPHSDEEPEDNIAQAEDTALRLAQSMTTDNFRAYPSTDLIGVEVGGATKNVLAIGAGISDGLGFGANTRIALVTRGLMEMTRLGVALGARKDTFMGLSGMGDLVLTCTDNQSRNRRFGLGLAKGADVEEARKAIGQTVEGYYAARAVRDVAARLKVEMPIVEEVYKVIYEGMSPQEAVVTLMRRPITPE